MSFIAKHILSHDERLVYATRLHKIYIVVGLIWATAFAAIGWQLQTWILHFAIRDPQANQIGALGYDFGRLDLWIFWAFAGTGLGLFLMHLFKEWSTEVALTTSRVIYKTGLFFVEVEEIEISEIRAEHVHHGIFGALFGYGSIMLDSRFVGDIHLPAIRRPYRFLRAIHKIRAQASGQGAASSPSSARAA